MKIKSIAFLILLLVPLSLFAGSGGPRYFFEGDGVVKMASRKNGKGGLFVYRDKKGDYDLPTLDKINEVFGLKTAPDEFIHPRLIALLDYLQDQLKGGTIRIVSGYRSPEYNDGLRRKGKLAAKSSMHIEGMAADIDMDGIDGKKLWEFVRGLDCCGAGYYHAKGIHVDVGPSRFWDETTTKVEQNLGSHNKLIISRTNFDYYRPAERVYMTFVRISDYPIGIRPKVKLETEKGKDVATLDIDRKDLKEENGCLMIPNRASARSVEFDLPEKIKADGKMAVRIDFCEKPFPEMPDSILSNTWIVRSDQ
ncbi:MAG TPA: DUF882 domain-containing protein [bacterium]|nr:DUF882 domain-containing protein [bacterium]